jgi:peptide/nickel transport system substrate-binding protein
MPAIRAEMSRRGGWKETRRVRTVLEPNSYWARRMRRRRFLGAVGLGTTAAAIAAACGGGGKQQSKATGAPSGGTAAAGGKATQAPSGAAGKAVRGGTFTVAMARDLTTLDPTKNQDVYGSTVLALVSEGLYEVDKDANTVPRVIEKAENPEPNVYVWTLRRGIKFQDGTDLDAEAVKFNINRHVQDEKSVRHQDVKDITAIDTPDPSTVKVTLKQPYAPFPTKLTIGSSAGTLLSPTAVQKLGDNLQRDLTDAGAGAFKFVQWQRDTQVTVQRNDTYWKKAADGSQLPYLDKVVLKIIPDENVRLTNVQTGDADALSGNPPPKDVANLKTSTDVVYKEIPDLGWSFITVNTSKEPFNNPAARRALSYAIDRDQILKTVFFGVGSVLDTPVPPTIPWAFDKDPSTHPYLKQNLDKAKQELSTAGMPNGYKFTVQISNASPVIQQTAELIKDQIKKIGLDMTIQPIEFGTLVQNADKGDYEAALIGWSGGTDPDGNLYSLFYTKAGFNLSKYSNPDFDKLLDQGRTTLDQTQRGDIYKQAQKILYQDQPFIVYYQNPHGMTYRRSVQNYPQTYNGYWGAADFDQVWKSK